MSDGKVKAQPAAEKEKRVVKQDIRMVVTLLDDNGNPVPRKEVANRLKFHLVTTDVNSVFPAMEQHPDSTVIVQTVKRGTKKGS